MRTYEKKNMSKSTAELAVLDEKSALDFHHAGQRSVVWKNTEKDNRMSYFIDSIIRDFSIPQIYCNCVFENKKNKYYRILDGKQRITCLLKFYRNDFKLIGLEQFEDLEGNLVDLNGLTYEELPEWAKDRVRTFKIDMVYYENLTFDEEMEVLKRYNNGVTFSYTQKLRVESKCFKDIQDLAAHPIFELALSNNAREKFQNENMVQKAYVILYNDEPNFTTVNMRNILKSLELSDEEKEDLREVFDKMKDIYDSLVKNKKKLIAKQLLKITHFVSFLRLVKANLKTDSKELADFVEHFFSSENRKSISELYNKYASEDSSKTNSILTRINEIQSSFDSFCKSNNTSIEEIESVPLSDVEGVKLGDIRELEIEYDEIEDEDL